ncbi:MAG: family 16 glycosylhydrolase, partial [Tannerella sp.]|nr:family 16 glycosylhydrolase [Tannerella sp.]
MKNKIRIAVIFLTIALPASYGAGYVTDTLKMRQAGWKLTFSDEFNGPEVDDMYWYTSYRSGREEYTKRQGKQGLEDPNTHYVIEDGILKLRIDKHLPYRSDESRMCVSSIQTSDHRVGPRANANYNGDSNHYVWMEKFAQKYGYYEVRARMPAGSGLHSAFWMTGADPARQEVTVPGERKKEGHGIVEIDIFEQLGSKTGPDKVNILDGNVHFTAAGNNAHPRIDLGFDASEDFHVYGLEWNEGELIWYIDGVKRHTYRGETPQMKMFILLGLYHNAGWTGDLDPNMVYPRDFEIDYVRVYAKENTEVSTEKLKLLSRLNLDSPGLEKVKAAADRPDVAVKELLAFYRNGGAGKHPVNPKDRAKFLGNCASERDLEWADNAVKHFFIGQPSYPPVFCGEDIMWHIYPVPDQEWIWQLHRMSFWNAMGRAYWHTGDEKYAEAWTEQLTDWVRKIPNDLSHDYAWRSLEAGIRGHSWMELFHRFIDSPSFTPDLLTTFMNSCHDHATYLMRKYKSMNNFALTEAGGLAFIAITFPQFKDALHWRNEAIRRFNREIDLQVYPDGHQIELSLNYHFVCIGAFMRTYELAKMNGIHDAYPDSFIKKIEKMCEVPMKILLPDGTHVMFGDDWEGKPGRHNQQFMEWAKLFDRPDFLYLATDGAQGAPPAETSYALPQSGIYSMRSGWTRDAVCLVLKCGLTSEWHTQPDNGTFDLYAGGKNLMPD